MREVNASNGFNYKRIIFAEIKIQYAKNSNSTGRFF